MKKGNILIIGLICIANAGVVISAGNFSKKENTIEIKQPKKATQNFTLNLTKTNEVRSNQELQSEIFNFTEKKEFEGENNALKVKMENITQTTYETQLDSYYPQIFTNPTGRCTMLNKYQITPYRYLTETQTKTNLTLYLQLEFNDFQSDPIYEQATTNLHLKITTYTSTQDWSQYIGQTNYYTYLNNMEIINAIENPNNEQVYNKQEQIQTITINQEPERHHITIEQEIEILKRPNEITQNYVFIYIQPYVDELQNGNYLAFGANNHTRWGYIDDFWENSVQITGTMIPQVNDYEVIDIPGLMFNILTMPFSFISTAFNLTLFPGTPYQINLSNLILTVMAIFIFVFIIKKIFIK